MSVWAKNGLADWADSGVATRASERNRGVNLIADNYLQRELSEKASPSKEAAAKALVFECLRVFAASVAIRYMYY